MARKVRRRDRRGGMYGGGTYTDAYEVISGPEDPSGYIESPQGVKNKNISTDRKSPWDSACVEIKKEDHPETESGGALLRWKKRYDVFGFWISQFQTQGATISPRWAMARW